ncbi:MAG: antibiotic biosynthesis monooxygenase [Planctomycetota bacterium]
MSKVLAGPYDPPYYAVVFSSIRREIEGEEYGAAAEWMEELASGQPGFLGFESVREPSGFGITVSYWVDLESVSAWGKHADHAGVQRLGRERWYAEYRLRVCRVEEERSGP